VSAHRWAIVFSRINEDLLSKIIIPTVTARKKTPVGEILVSRWTRSPSLEFTHPTQLDTTKDPQPLDGGLRDKKPQRQINDITITHAL